MKGKKGLLLRNIGRRSNGVITQNPFWISLQVKDKRPHDQDVNDTFLVRILRGGILPSQNCPVL